MRHKSYNRPAALGLIFLTSCLPGTTDVARPVLPHPGHAEDAPQELSEPPLLDCGPSRRFRAPRRSPGVQPAVLGPTDLRLGPGGQIVPAQWPMRPLPPMTRASHIARTLEYRMRRALVRFDRRTDQLPDPGAREYPQTLLQLLEDTEDDVLGEMHPREFPELAALRAFVCVELDRAMRRVEQEARLSAAAPRGQGRVAHRASDHPWLHLPREAGRVVLASLSSRPVSGSSVFEWAKHKARTVIRMIECHARRNDLLTGLAASARNCPTPPCHLWLDPLIRSDASRRLRPWLRTDPIPGPIARIYRGLYRYEVTESHKAPERDGGRGSEGGSSEGRQPLDLVAQDGPIACDLAEAFCRLETDATEACER